jgi:hypothetical protein
MKECLVCHKTFQELIQLPCGHEACIVCHTITLDVTGKCEVCEKPLEKQHGKKPHQSAHDDPCSLSFLCGVVMIGACFILISVYVTK